MTRLDEPLVSCLTVTEARPAFMPWLLWCFERQEYGNCELVIVDSSPEPLALANRDDIHVLPATPSTGVAAKRNMALEAARGEIITWFDDDDWQHPRKVRWLVDALRDGAPYAGSPSAWFVDLYNGHCRPHRQSGRRILFNSSGFLRKVARQAPFPEHVRRASDTRWLQEITARYRSEATVLEQPALFFWLCHDDNLSNPAGRRRPDRPLDDLRQVVGEKAWGDTDEALSALRERLAEPAATHDYVQIVEREAESDERRKADRASKPEPVSVMIKATVMDAPFLRPMVRHMISQARYPFAERVVVVDRNPSSGGKYRSRARATNAELDRVLARLLDNDEIDRVLDVDMRNKTVRRVMERYFGHSGRRVPTHATTGGPIYATLFGMEAVASDLVLQMDADILFHASKESWVAQALHVLNTDPNIWLMMTHPGPPAGPPGASIGAGNSGRGIWDPGLRLWRFRHATTRYFLCDRRRLRGRLHPLFRGRGCLPLEKCISAAMERHGTFRGNLGYLGSWHLHAWYHGPPFAQWLPSLLQAVEAGDFPSLQAGDYDLRLDRPAARRAWQALLQKGTSDKSRVKERGNSKPTTAAVATEPRPPASGAAQAPLAVVIPIRNRTGQRLRNTLRGLHWQSVGSPAQILLVSHGSRPAVDKELGLICHEEGATLLVRGRPHQPWNKSLALNIGIRAARRELPFVMTMDADMILAPNFLEVVLERLQREPPALVLCRISDLPRHASLPRSSSQLRQAFNRLRRMTRLRKRSGSGGIQAASRNFFFDIRGYDEDLLWWGAMDGDILNRARLLGLELTWIEKQTSMLHQWHPRKHRILDRRNDIEQAKRFWRRNHDLVRQRAEIARRNPDGWGGIAEN